MLYYLPFYFESVRDYSPTLAGVTLLAITGGMFSSSAVVGVVMSRLGSFRWAVWAGWGVTTLGTGLLILLKSDTNPGTWAPVLVVIGLGHGLLLSGMVICAQAIAQTRDVAYAAAMYSFARTFGFCLGVAIGGAVFTNQLPKRLAEAGLPSSIATDATSYVVQLTGDSLSPEYRASVARAYAQALRTVFEVMTGISVAGGIISLAIRPHTMDKPLDSEHVLRPEQEQQEKSLMGK